jgi:prepilin-type N-terminal cleavage/methylation domain-containing protein
MKRHRRCAFTLVEVLVVLAIIAILIGLLLPAVQKVRDVAALIVCKNNLKQLALACLDYESTRRGLPPIGSRTQDPGWVTEILPYLDQNPLYARYNFKAPWFDASNADVVNQVLPILVCPADPVGGRVFEATDPAFATLDPGGTPDINYAAANSDYFAFMGANTPCYQRFYPGTPATADLSGAMQLYARRKMVALTDGASQTAMLSEMAGRPWIYVTGGRPTTGSTHELVYGFGAWAHNNAFNVGCYSGDGLTPGGACVINCSNLRAVYSFHFNGAHAALCDGSVQMLPYTISGRTFFGLVTHAGNEVVDMSEF